MPDTKISVGKIIEQQMLPSEHNVLYKDPQQVVKGKYFAKDPTSKYKQAKQVTAALNDYMGQIGMGGDDVSDLDTLDLLAMHLIEAINTDTLHISNLTRHEQYILFRYFSRLNPIMARILDLHTDIPLSKIRLQPPRGVPEVVKDYVMNFFEGIFEKVNFNDLIRELVLTYFIYGRAHVFVDDYYGDKERELQDPDVLSLAENVYTHSDEDAKFLKDIEERYVVHPDSVSLRERQEYLEKKFIGFFCPDYKGPSRMFVIKFYDIDQWFDNPDISFEAIRYKLSFPLRTLLAEGESMESLVELGYSKGFVKLVQEAYQGDPSRANLTVAYPSKDTIIIDNDYKSGLPFMFSFLAFEGNSLVKRVLNECLQWDMSRRAYKAKIDNLGKVGRVVTSENLSEDQTGFLRAEVQKMLEDPGYAIIANFPIEWAEVNRYQKDELSELMEMSEKIIKEICVGCGIPDSLLTGESQYSGDNIKLEILNTQYLALKFTVQNVLLNKFLKPMALRKGFITIDAWGNPKLIVPTVAFSRVSIRDEAVYDLCFSLYQKGSLPVSIIYDLLNFETEDLERQLVDDLFTVRDANFNRILEEIYTRAADDMYAETDIKGILKVNMGLITEAQKRVEDQKKKLQEQQLQQTMHDDVRPQHSDTEDSDQEVGIQ